MHVCSGVEISMKGRHYEQETTDRKSKKKKKGFSLIELEGFRGSLDMRNIN